MNMKMYYPSYYPGLAHYFYDLLHPSYYPIFY
jgi:hypothetical protein